MMKLLLLDLETSPNVAHVWSLFKQTVSVEQLQESSYVMCWSAKWLGSREMLHRSLYVDGKKRMLKELHSLLDACDAVVTFNGTSFDIPVANKEFLLTGLKPPSPYAQIDLLRTARDTFRFPSNKLSYISRALQIGQKVKHKGHQLWVECLAGDEKAWHKMAEYNKQDVVLLEKLYNKLQPWIKGHPNKAFYVDDLRPVCPNCGSWKVQRRGYAYTTLSKFHRLQCQECGKWSRENKNMLPKTKQVLRGI